MPRLSVDLEDKLYDGFSVVCAKKRLKKADVVRRLITQWVKENA